MTTLGGVVSGFRGARGVAEAILHGGESGELKLCVANCPSTCWCERLCTAFSGKTTSVFSISSMVPPGGYSVSIAETRLVQFFGA